MHSREPIPTNKTTPLRSGYEYTPKLAHSEGLSFPPHLCLNRLEPSLCHAKVSLNVVADFADLHAVISMLMTSQPLSGSSLTSSQIAISIPPDDKPLPPLVCVPAT